jgi:hypothetical protein
MLAASHSASDKESEPATSLQIGLKNAMMLFMCVDS